ncbi:hypothetical protein [Aquiflexum gelatinilyticum]|jgi:hypothetical protein|uniref:Uncharacterized protein n=1 Tax=Aquiflexum gelatinilyticum TaxID=2961943 RepID=A0A9X2T3V4_9BACT|nr:hypothetical protein [Aquiflexum gelatinilyticum]MCR9016820.1 hypothetical protein [Aquiflexum gelatinilyticum]
MHTKASFTNISNCVNFERFGMTSGLFYEKGFAFLPKGSKISVFVQKVAEWIAVFKNAFDRFGL